MGIMQTAYRTYESHEHLTGLIISGEKEALAPVSHMFINAQLEITIDKDGNFIRADTVKNEKTMIPATIESANRTGQIAPHPLSDQLEYVAPYGGDKHTKYVENLAMWVNSPFTHPKAVAVLKYTMMGTVVDDLVQCGILDTSAPKGSKFDKHLIRWRVILDSDENKSACWEDTSLFSSFAEYFKALCAENDRGLCMISGEQDILCELHPKGIIAADNGAKLLSSNDNSGFTYRGRFTQPREAFSIGYTASQKAHSALRWISANQGVIIGGRTFICWNPKGKPVSSNMIFGLPSEIKYDYDDYRKQLLETLSGYRMSLSDTDEIVIAAMSAATTGRLSVTYYNELLASDFLRRIENWYSTVCWASMWRGVISPTIKHIAVQAFGVERGKFIELDDKILRDQVQRLIRCVVDEAPIPADIVSALTAKAGTPLAYSSDNREYLLTTACAVIRKYRNDKLNKEEWKLALDKENTDRSYLFGRLLAVSENVERSTYDRDEKREPNAIRMQSVFAQRPLYAWRIIDEKLNPYFARLAPGLRSYYKNIISEITEKLPDTTDLGKRLDDTYLLGYYHQRNAFYQKRETKIEEDSENGNPEQED